MPSYDAIVLAGGQGRRLGGVDKATLEVGSKRLLDHALEAVRRARHTIVVGPPRRLPAGIDRVVEDPPGGGPAAGISAALPLVRSRLVVVLACDMPLVTLAVVERLVAALAAGGAPQEHFGIDAASHAQSSVPGPLVDAAPLAQDSRHGPNVDAAPLAQDSRHGPNVDAALLVNEGGRRQFLAGAYRASSLRRAVQEIGSPDGVAVHRLIRHFTITEVPADASVTLDCDTWEDITLLRHTMEAP